MNDNYLDDEKFADVKGEKISGGFEGPSWRPQYAVFNDAEKAAKLGKAGKGSTARQNMAGKLVLATAWGRPMYFFDVETAKNGMVRVLLPEHTSLYSSLNTAALGCKVSIAYKGKKDLGKGRSTHVYDVVAEKIADKSRTIRPETDAEKEARKTARETRYAESSAAIDPRAEDDEAIDA